VGVPLANAEFRLALFPHANQLDFNFEAIRQILVIWWLQFREGYGEGGP
jgi:hypothetical protein